MRFLVDECVGPAVGSWLRARGHDVYSIYEQARGADDDTIFGMARSDSRILLTSDKDFGEKVYRDQAAHCGIVLLRLIDQSVAAKTTALDRLLATYPDRLESAFIVVTDSHIRFGRMWRAAPEQ